MNLLLSRYISCNAGLYTEGAATALDKTQHWHIFNHRVMRYHSLCVALQFVRGTRKGEGMRVVPKTAFTHPPPIMSH